MRGHVLVVSTRNLETESDTLLLSAKRYISHLALVRRAKKSGVGIVSASNRFIERMDV